MAFKPSQKCATTTAMFMWSGIESSKYRDGKTFSDVLDAWDQGCLELAMQLSEWGMESEKLLAKRNPQDFPGVYDYEVSESFGQWVGQYILDHPHEFPPKNFARSQLERLIDEFFAQGAQR